MGWLDYVVCVMIAIFTVDLAYSILVEKRVNGTEGGSVMGGGMETT